MLHSFSSDAKPETPQEESDRGWQRLVSGAQPACQPLSHVSRRLAQETERTRRT